MLIEPDLSQIKEDVAPGEYHVRVVSAESGEWNTQKGITKYLDVRLETCNEEEPKNNGRSIFHKAPYTGGGAFKFKNFYEAATGSKLEPGQAISTEELLGRELLVVVDKNDKGYIEVKAEKAIQ